MTTKQRIAQRKDIIKVVAEIIALHISGKILLSNAEVQYHLYSASTDAIIYTGTSTLGSEALKAISSITSSKGLLYRIYASVEPTGHQNIDLYFPPEE